MFDTSAAQKSSWCPGAIFKQLLLNLKFNSCFTLYSVIQKVCWGPSCSKLCAMQAGLATGMRSWKYEVVSTSDTGHEEQCIDICRGTGQKEGSVALQRVQQSCSIQCFHTRGYAKRLFKDISNQTRASSYLLEGHSRIHQNDNQKCRRIAHHTICNYSSTQVCVSRCVYHAYAHGHSCV